MMVTVAEYMSSPVHTVDDTMSLGDLDELFDLHGVSAFAVEDARGRAVGVVSRTDLFRVSRSEDAPRSRTLVVPDVIVRDIMREDLVSLPRTEPLARAARLMTKKLIHRVFVLDGGGLEGVVAVSDVMRALVDARLATPIGELMTRSIVSVRADQPMRIAADRIAAAHKHGLVVLDGPHPVGIVSAEEVMLARDWPDDTPVEEWMNVRVLCLPVGMPAFRAAAHALAMHVRHVLATDEEGLRGIVTGIDFARALR